MKKVIVKRERKIESLKRAINNHKEISVKWDGTVHDYILWSLDKWNKGAYSEDKITLEDLDINAILLNTLKYYKFPEKKDDLTGMFPSGRICK